MFRTTDFRIDARMLNPPGYYWRPHGALQLRTVPLSDPGARRFTYFRTVPHRIGPIRPIASSQSAQFFHRENKDGGACAAATPAETNYLCAFAHFFAWTRYGVSRTPFDPVTAEPSARNADTGGLLKNGKNSSP